MNSRFRWFILLFLCLAAVLPAGGKKEKSTIVQVTGRLRLVGSGPAAELVITGQDREWYVAKGDQDKLKDFQHRIVTVEGAETITELKFANGMSAGERRTLKNIKIITIE